MHNLASTGRRIVQTLAAITGNRVELLLVEWQEERERLVLTGLFLLGAVTFALLGGIALTIAVTLAFWDQSPILAVGILGGIYFILAAYFFLRLHKLKRNWESFPETLQQIKKDTQIFLSL